MVRLLSLEREDRGTVTIELALIAPILATMLVGLVDIGTAFSHKLRLEQIANRAIEKVQQDGFDTTYETTIEAEVVAAAGSGATADLTYWLECAGTKVSSYTGGCTTGQSVARYVQVEVVKSHTPIITAQFTGSNANGTMTVRGISGIRTQ
ncbi:MAG: pilus assembly protein [Pseudomonadota bacterium]|nr:pilus assembly protein [Pseudomonadota bacterium]